MIPETFLDGRVTLIVADVFAGLASIDDESIDEVVTSPPYWGLRDYGVEGQIGLEPSLGEHLDVMVGVFREVRRVLKPHGTVFLNYGDCYATAPNGRSAADGKAAGTDDRTFRDKPFSTVGPIRPTDSDVSRSLRSSPLEGPIYRAEYEKTSRVGASANKGNGAAAHGGRVVAGGTLKPKDLCMIPNRLAIALQDDGWWVRSEIVWAKPNAMPDSSGRYRPSTAHEKIFLLTKSADADVWRARDTGEVSFEPDQAERCPLETDPTRDAARWSRMGHYYDANAVRVERAGDDVSKSVNGWASGDTPHNAIAHNRGARPERSAKAVRGRSTHGRHTLGDALPEGERRGACDPRHDGTNHTGLADLGRGEGRLLRNYEPAPLEVWEIAARAYSGAHFATFPPELAARAIAAGCPPGGRVLDPFGGAGTTALVAARLGRLATLIEINPEYAAQARARIEAEWRVVRRPAESAPAEGLFAWSSGEGRAL